MTQGDRALDPRTFDEYAARYEASIAASIGASGESHDYFVELRVRMMQAALADAPTPGVVLDFGCGVGLGTRALARGFPTSDVMGCDPSRESIRLARAQGASPRVQFVEQSSERVPLDDAAADVVLASGVFHHIVPSERARWLHELARVTRPGGRLFVFEHNPLNPLTRRAMRLCAFDEGAVMVWPRALRRMLSSSGWESSAAQYYFFFPRALAFARPMEDALRRVPFGAQYLVSAARRSSAG